MYTHAKVMFIHGESIFMVLLNYSNIPPWMKKL